MSTRERTVVFGLLGLLVALVLFRAPEIDRSAVANAPAADPVLGPASALTLTGPKGDLSLRNEDGRLGWGKPPFARAYSVGFVHITKPLRRIREQASFIEELESVSKELNELNSDYQKRLQEIVAAVDKVKPDAPEHQELTAQGQKLLQEYQVWQRGAQERMGRLEASHLEKAYRQLIDAVEVVSDRLGIDIVYRFIATADPFDAPDPMAAMNEIRFRSVLRYPEALDITPAVLKELGFEE